MSGFLADAGEIFEVATAAAGAGEAASDLAILVEPDGAIRMMDASGWQMPALAAHTGARTVYRVTRSRSHVRVEGHSGSRSCVLQTETPASRAASLLHTRSPFVFSPLQIPA